MATVRGRGVAGSTQDVGKIARVSYTRPSFNMEEPPTLTLQLSNSR